MPPGIYRQYTTFFLRQIIYFLCKTGEAQPRVPRPVVAYHDGSIRKFWWRVIHSLVQL
jgi:hypothetical protein